MTISIEASNGVCHACVAGEMTIYHAAEMKGELLPCLERGTEVEIDLSEVSEMDTAGFQLLLLVKREAANAGKSLRLVAHSPATLEVLDLFNMAAYFGDPVMMPRAAH
ncbi:MAG: anti-sigma B factor antagonist [Gallionellales bacterium GWA2_60_18]|nr:MAG: anti-sigma B factor antagonist [Gallionellales bacterium GWA2_60_18]